MSKRNRCQENESSDVDIVKRSKNQRKGQILGERVNGTISGAHPLASQRSPGGGKQQCFNMSRLSDYKKLEKLGEGTYGVVSKAVHIPTGRIVAMKKVKLERDEEGIPATTLREISLLQELQHPNVVSLLGCIYSRESLYLIFEHLTYDLKKFLDHTGKCAPAQVKFIMLELFKGVDFCHRNRFLHRDLKPQNILVSSDGKKIKIADFGLGREHGIPIMPLTHEVVTLWYRCPEILLGAKTYGGGVDSWALGCIMAELVKNSPLFPGDCEIDEIFRIFRLLGTPTPDTWPDCAKLRDFNAQFPRWAPKKLESVLVTDALTLDLIGRLLELNPVRRISMKQALLHPYVHN